MGLGISSRLGSQFLQGIFMHLACSQALESQPLSLTVHPCAFSLRHGGPTGLPRMAAEKPSNCWKEALAWVYLLPWVPGQKEVESLRFRAPLGPERRAEMRGMNLGLPEALDWSQTRVSLTYPLTSPASWVGGGPFVFSISFFIFIHLAAPSLCCNLESGSFQDPLRILDLLCSLSDP